MSSPDDARSSPEDAPACTSQTDPALPPASLAFLKTHTKIEDDAALTAHLRALQARALAVHPYPCIKRFGFARLKIDAQRAAYERVLALGREVPGALVLDVGCCFGGDLRKLASDGFPVAQLVGSDLRREFWDLGHALFRSTPESFPAAFVAGDVFDPAFLAPEPPSAQDTDSDEVDLRAITTLSALRGRLAAVHTASLFHLFGEAQQRALAGRLAGLLSPRAGSMVFGCHGALPSRGYAVGSARKRMFCHSPESWGEMWAGVFEPGRVEVRTEMRNVGRVLDEGSDFWMMLWLVERV